jgi:hypothetical protein
VRESQDQLRKAKSELNSIYSEKENSYSEKENYAFNAVSYWGQDFTFIDICKGLCIFNSSTICFISLMVDKVRKKLKTYF